jgi:hypothetical protein
MSRTLFIGGCRDGEWIGTPDSQSGTEIFVRRRGQLDASPVDEIAESAPLPPIHKYRRMRLRCGDREWSIFRWAMLAEGEVFELLLNCYHPKEETE